MANVVSGAGVCLPEGRPLNFSFRVTWIWTADVPTLHSAALFPPEIQDQGDLYNVGSRHLLLEDWNSSTDTLCRAIDCPITSMFLLGAEVVRNNRQPSPWPKVEGYPAGSKIGLAGIPKGVSYVMIDS